MARKTVRVPTDMAPVFAKAEEAVAQYFAQFRADPTEGTIEISGERYVLIRAAALSVEFFSLIERLFGADREAEAHEFARNLLFDLAHAIGKSDARSFHKRMGLEDPIDRLSAGPVHFSHSGWAFVDILPESRPAANDDYYLIYDHPYSFEADAWLRSGRKAAFPACIMNAGYSSGWCEESFGPALVASEILCRARGDECCRFIMAPPHRIEAHIEHYSREKPQLAPRIRADNFPDFFARKRAEDAQRLAARQWQDTFDAVEDLVILIDREHRVLRANKAARQLLPDREIVGLPCCKLIHGTDAPLPDCPSCEVFETGEAMHVEIQEPHLDDRWFDVYAYPIKDEAGTTVQMVHIIRDITERKQAEEELGKTLDDLERFNRLAVGRELRMIELKREVNEMARRAGVAPPYDLSFAEASKADSDVGRRRTRGAELMNTAQDRGGP